MDTVFLCLLRLFGFGLPYMMCTRTPWEDNIYFIGVPPVDILSAILQPDTQGQNWVERERIRLRNLLDSSGGVEAEIDKRTKKRGI